MIHEYILRLELSKSCSFRDEGSAHPAEAPLLLSHGERLPLLAPPLLQVDGDLTALSGSPGAGADLAEPLQEAERRWMLVPSLRQLQTRQLQHGGQEIEFSKSLKL